MWVIIVNQEKSEWDESKKHLQFKIYLIHEKGAKHNNAISLIPEFTFDYKNLYFCLIGLEARKQKKKYVWCSPRCEEFLRKILYYAL